MRAIRLLGSMLGVLVTVLALAEAPQPALVIPQGHQSEVLSITVSPDGTRAVSTAYGEMFVWETATGRPVVNLKNTQLGVVYTAAFSADGTRLAINIQGGLAIWDLKTMAMLNAINSPGQEGQQIAFSPDGTLLARASGGLVNVWSVATGQLTRSHQLPATPGGVIRALAYPAPDRMLLAIYNAADHTVRMRTWNPTTGDLVGESTPVAAASQQVWVSRDGARWLWYQGGIVVLADVTTGERLVGIPLPLAGIESLSASEDGKWIAVAYTLQDGAVTRTNGLLLWDSAAKQERLRLPPRPYMDPEHLRLARAAPMVITGETLYVPARRTVRAWAVRTGQPQAGLGEGAARWLPYALAWGTDGLYLLQAEGALLRLPFVGPSTMPRVAEGVYAPLVGFPGGMRMVYTAKGQEKAVIVELPSGRTLAELPTGHGYVTDVAVARDGARVAMVSTKAQGYGSGRTASQRIRVWEAATGTLLHEASRAGDGVSRLTFAVNGTELIGLGADTLLIWPLTAPALPEPRQVALAGAKMPMAYAPQQQLVAYAMHDKVGVYDLAAGALIRTLPVMKPHIRHVVFSSDGSLLAVNTDSTRVFVYETATWTLKHDLTAQQSAEANFLSFSPDGSRLLIGNRVDWRVWKVADGTLFGGFALLEPADWVAMSASQQYDASPATLQRLYWQVGTATAALDAHAAGRYTPGLLGTWLTTK